MSAAAGGRSRSRHLLEEILLWSGAGLGLLCIAGAVASWVLGVTFLVFQSGSMSPAHEPGALGLARSVPASELRVGDVVSVPRGEGGRVTHRVVAVERLGEEALLTLQGDTNPLPDAATHRVTRADRVVLSIPLLGRATAHAQGPAGLVAVGGLVAALAWLAWRPRVPPSGRELHPIDRASVRTVLVVGLVCGSAGGALAAWAVTPTDAAWTDSAVAVSDPVAAATLASPVALSTTQNCTGGVGSVTLRWGGVTPTPGPPLSSYQYTIEVWDRGTNQQLGSTQVLAHGGAAGSTQSVSYSSSLLGNLFGLNLIGTQNLQFRIRSRLTGSSWVGATTVPINVRAVTVLATTFTCNA